MRRKQRLAQISTAEKKGKTCWSTKRILRRFSAQGAAGEQIRIVRIVFIHPMLDQASAGYWREADKVSLWLELDNWTFMER